MILKVLEDQVIDKWVLEVEKETWVSRKTINSMISGRSKKHHKKTLDVLYDHYRLDKNEPFYKENLRKRNPKTTSILGTLIRNKRMGRNIDQDDLCKKIKIDKRSLARLELWESLPTVNSYTMQHIFSELSFTDEEIEVTERYIEDVKKLEKIVKSYD